MTQHQVILIFKALRDGVEMSFHVLAPTVSFQYVPASETILGRLARPCSYHKHSFSQCVRALSLEQFKQTCTLELLYRQMPSKKLLRRPLFVYLLRLPLLVAKEFLVLYHV